MSTPGQYLMPPPNPYAALIAGIGQYGGMAGPSAPLPGLGTSAPNSMGMAGLNGQPWSGMSADQISSFGAGNAVGPASSGPMDWLNKNGGTIGGLIQGFGTLASAYSAYKGLGLAKDQLKFQKDAYGQNMTNSIASYNTSLEERVRGASSNYAGKEADVQAYLSAHRLNKTTKK